jgi:hypothetical protein
MCRAFTASRINAHSTCIGAPQDLTAGGTLLRRSWSREGGEVPHDAAVDTGGAGNGQAPEIFLTQTRELVPVRSPDR